MARERDAETRESATTDQIDGIPGPRFPGEFAILFKRREKATREQTLSKRTQADQSQSAPLSVFSNILNSKAVDACRSVLDRVLYSHLREYDVPIAPETITGMTRNYEEQLPKALRFKSAVLHNKRTAAYKAAKSCGLIDMLRSESLARFAESVTGYKLQRPCGMQVILYEEGDYVGPHNDHHPENEEAESGYVDLHICLVNSAVLDQFLVCEDTNHLSRMYDVSINGTVAVSKLPFWHYTTPLRTKPDASLPARRWLVLATFNIDSSVDKTV